MTLSIDLYWSFRSPYSYLVTPRLVAFAKEYDVTVNVLPVYPIALRIANFFKNVDPLLPSYFLLDTARVAQMLGLDYAWPNPDPVVMDFTTGHVPKEQPFIHRLTRLGCAAVEAGKGLAFIDQVSRVIWSGTPNWHEGTHLVEAAMRAGLNLGKLDNLIDQHTERYEEKIESNQKAQRAAGHWGVPLMVFENEPFFGQDRFECLKWRMAQKGLAKRSNTT